MALARRARTTATDVRSIPTCSTALPLPSHSLRTAYIAIAQPQTPTCAFLQCRHGFPSLAYILPCQPLFAVSSYLAIVSGLSRYTSSALPRRTPRCHSPCLYFLRASTYRIHSLPFCMRANITSYRHATRNSVTPAAVIIWTRTTIFAA